MLHFNGPYQSVYRTVQFSMFHVSVLGSNIISVKSVCVSVPMHIACLDTHLPNYPNDTDTAFGTK